MCQTFGTSTALLRAAVLPAALLAVALAANACAAVPQEPEFWGFTGPWDPRSDSSVVENGAGLDAVVSGWIALDSISGQPIVPPLFPDTLVRRDGTPRHMALVTTWHGDRFHAAPVRKLGRDPAALAAAAAALARHAADAGYDGLVFDFEMLEPGDLDAQLAVLRAMADSARDRGVQTIAVAIPATDTAAYPADPLLEVADVLVVMLYDQHWPGSPPGPVVDPAWFRESLRLRLAKAVPDRIVAGLPLYGYRWPPNGMGEPVTFAEARQHAARAGSALGRDPASGTLRTVEPDGTETWVTDAELLRTLMRAARSVGVHRFALWRLGQEDPAIWDGLIR